MKKKGQMSDTIMLGLVLAISGGFMDAYSYILRDHVFANAQTGNMLLFGIYLSEHDYEKAIRYFFPVISFVIGIVISEVIRFRVERKRKKEHKKALFHWRQVAVFVELAVLFCVGFIPLEYNLQANCITSLACGIQVESFRKIHGNAIATTMCIGNLRSGVQNVCLFWNKKDKAFLGKSALYFGIIIFFVIGAILGNICIGIFKERAILFCSAFLLITFFMMFINQIDEESYIKDRMSLF